jgi:hypothetical protein
MIHVQSSGQISLRFAQKNVWAAKDYFLLQKKSVHFCNFAVSAQKIVCRNTLLLIKFNK